MPVPLQFVAQYSKTRISAQEVDEFSYVGVDNLLQNKLGKTNAQYIPEKGSLIEYGKEDILVGNIRPYLRKIWYADGVGGTNGDVLVIKAVNRDMILPRYLFHVLSDERFFTYDIKKSKGAKMPRGDKDAIMEYTFTIPDIEKQKCIISILDRFDTLCHDLSQGLPAEIEARKKQYAYYRDKLLSFPKSVVR